MNVAQISTVHHLQQTVQRYETAGCVSESRNIPAWIERKIYAVNLKKKEEKQKLCVDSDLLPIF